MYLKSGEKNRNSGDPMVGPEECVNGDARLVSKT